MESDPAVISRGGLSAAAVTQRHDLIKDVRALAREVVHHHRVLRAQRVQMLPLEDFKLSLSQQARRRIIAVRGGGDRVSAVS